MTIPVWVLLLFAAWTVVLLSGTVGYFRWSRILTGRAFGNSLSHALHVAVRGIIEDENLSHFWTSLSAA
jgi:hypothetical protein